MVKLYLGLGALAAAVAGWLYISHLRSEVREARAAEAAARTQSQIETAKSQALDTYQTTSKTLRRKAEDAADAVERAPGADDVFEPRDVLCAELERLRNEPVCLEPDGP